MKFNLSDFLQLDTKELLAVNGGSPCSSSSGSPSGSSSGSPSDGSGAPSSSSTNSSDGGTKTIYVPRGPFYGEQVTVRTKGNNNSSKNGNNDNSSKTVPEAWSGGSGSSGGGSCSTSTSNNPNGQGPSTTSSNPGGDTKIYSGGGTCTKTGGHSPVNPDDVTSGGGTCSSKNDTDKVSGMFGQITDGSYADELTMQYYKNKPGYMFHPGVNDEAMYGTYTVGEETHDCIFSKVGCIETASAKIASELTGDEVPLISINNNFDANKDGDLSLEDIAIGIDKLLDQKYGDIYDVIGKNINNPSLGDLNEVATPAEGDICFVLGKSPDCHGGHWVVLEGYSTNSNGVVTFSYDGTSDNDVGRSFVLGKNNQDVNNNVYGITRIETFTIHKK